MVNSSGLNLVIEPIESNNLWGAGWYNAADVVNYADNAIRYEGDIGMSLQGSKDAWNFFRDWGIEQRAYSRSCDISPDGARLFRYWNTAPGAPQVYNKDGLWCTSMGFSASEGGFVDLSVNAVGLTREMVDPEGGTNFSNFSYINQRTGVIGTYPTAQGFTTLNPLNPGGDNQDPIPYWQTNARIRVDTGGSPWTAPFGNEGANPQVGTEIVEWSVDLSNNHVILYTCNGDREASAVLQGAINISGSVTMYNIDGVFDPILGPTGTEGTLTSPYMYAENSWFQVLINPPAAEPGATRFIEMPAIYIDSDDYGLRGQSDITNRVFSMRGLGGRLCDLGSGEIVVPPLLMNEIV